MNGNFHTNTIYKFVVDAGGMIRMFDYKEWLRDLGSTQSKVPGHSSLFSRREYLNMYIKKIGIIWAGDFNTDGQGNIKDWDNFSGHFEPSDTAKAKVAKYLGISVNKFVTFEERLQQLDEENAKSNVAMPGSIQESLSSRESLTSVESPQTNSHNAMALFGDSYESYPLDGIYI